MLTKKNSVFKSWPGHWDDTGSSVWLLLATVSLSQQQPYFEEAHFGIGGAGGAGAPI